MRLTKMARELLDINEDLMRRTHGKYIDEMYDVVDFDQTWASTALGFPGMGGAAITTARTYVVTPVADGAAYIYFAGCFAYKVDNPNKKFEEDLRMHQMARVMESDRYST